MPKLFVPSNFSTSNLALETTVLTAKGFVEDSAKWFVEESQNSLVIILPNNQISKQINEENPKEK